VECTIENAFNLRDLELQELVKIIVVYYIKDLRLKFKSGFFYGSKAARAWSWKLARHKVQV